MRAIAILTSLVVLLMLQGTALAEDKGPEAELAVTDVPETLTDGQEAAADAQDAGADAQPAAGEGDSDDLLDEAQLDQLVAPIALYSDPLLAQVLVASTYPLEVVQAERWRADNEDVTGEALTKALDDKGWDNSIKALVAVPDALGMMSKDLDWTAKLGDAVLAQQPDVMTAVQRMRALAQENGNLESNDQQTVTVTQEVNITQPAASASSGTQAPAPQQVIVIEPTSPETVYVPYYQPSVVYGSWPYPSYPPYYFPPPLGYGFGGALARGVVWGAGFAVGNAIWGNGFNWGRNDININVNRNLDFSPNANFNKNNVNVSNWQHNSDHRRGVNYNNKDVSNKFSKGDGANKRQDFRGREPGDKRPGDKRPGDKRPGDKRPGGGGLADKRPGDGGLGGKRPGDKRPGDGGLADKRPGDKRPGDKRPGADKRPSVGDMESALKRSDGGAKRPDGKRSDGKGPNAKRPEGGAKRPDIKKPSAGGKRPAAKKPAAKKPKVANRPAAKKPAAKRKPAAKKKPSGNAFKKSNGSKAKQHSNRGRSSSGNRKPSSAGRSRSSASRGRSSGGRSGGGGRGGGGRRR